VHGSRQPLGQLGDEACVAGAGLAARLVVEVDDVRRHVRPAEQQ
jgi:hypothetical protein